MTGWILVAALVAGVAVAGGMRPGPVTTRAWAWRAAAGPPDQRGAGGSDPLKPATTGSRPASGTTRARSVAAGLVAGAAAWLLIEGVPGALTGCVVAVAVPAVSGRLEPAATRRERLALVRAAPMVADLLGAALLAGVPMEQATPVVGRALGGPAGRRLLEVHRRIALGQSATDSFSTLAGTPGLGSIARAVARSSRTGAPLAALLAQVAVDLRAEAAAAGLEQVRATAVRAVLPLGLCLLPAFVMLGIVPIVGGLLPEF